MTVCEICNSSDFELLNGFYYCTECQTQIKDIREEMEEVDFIDEANTTQGRRSYRTVISNKKKKSCNISRVRRILDYGRPWRTCEGYTIIMKEQVHFLISNGANRKLQETLFTLWKRYLAKAGQTYCGGKGRHFRTRDKYPGTTDTPRPINLHHVSKMQEWHALNKSKKKTANEKWFENIKKEDEDYTENNPFLKYFDECSSDDSLEESTLNGLDNTYFDEKEHVNCSISVGVSAGLDDKSKYEDITTKLGNKSETTTVNGDNELEYDNKLNIFCGRDLLLLDTVSFCYLALLLNGEFIRSESLIEWVNNGSFPLKNALKLLPDECNIYNEDTNLFNSDVVLSTDFLKKSTGHLASFLDINTIDYPPVSDFCFIYLKRLHLPADLNRMVLKLYEAFPVSYHNQEMETDQHFVFCYEIYAMAYIVITLKLLFGLNNYTELYMSHYANELMKLGVFNEKLFIWDEWLNYKTSTIKYKAKSKCHIEKASTLFSKIDRIDFRDKQFYSMPLNNHEYMLHYEKWTKEHTKKDTGVHVYKNSTTERKNELIRLLDQLMPAKVFEKKPCDSNTGVNFIESTVRYITDDLFLDCMGGHGIVKYTVSGSSISDNLEYDEPIELQTNVNIAHKVIRSVLDDGLKSMSNISADKQNELKELRNIIKTSKKAYICDLKTYRTLEETHLEYRNFSYDAFLDICANELNCNVISLKLAINSLEQVMFSLKSIIKTKQGPIRNPKVHIENKFTL